MTGYYEQLRRTRDAMSDTEFWADVVGGAWLLYGDLDEHFAAFVQKVFARAFSDWAFTPRPLAQEPPDFQVAYWLFLSELNRQNLVEYGTSPRGAWLTPAGERFKRIFEERVARDGLDFEWQPDIYDETESPSE